MLLIHAEIAKLCTAKRIIEGRGIQTSSSFVKIWLVCIPEFRAIYLFFWRLYGLDFLSRIYWSSLDHDDPMAGNWEKAISILAENLNSSCSFVITAVQMDFSLKKSGTYMYLCSVKWIKYPLAGTKYLLFLHGFMKVVVLMINNVLALTL